MGWSEIGIIFAVAAVLSSVGYYRFIYFISIGYGLAISGIGVTLAIMNRSGADAPYLLLCALLICYGFRLSGFLFIRERKSASYRKTLAATSAEYKKRNLLESVGVWIVVSALYVAQTSPVFFLYQSNGSHTLAKWIGVIVCAAALILESVADMQKSAQKKKKPDMVATLGLYKYVRCPNYFSEILFWTGVFISGLDAMNLWGKWLIAITGYVLIVFIMFNGAYRMERRQNKTYGDNEEYIAYTSSTPIIIPFIPLYHLIGKASNGKTSAKV